VLWPDDVRSWAMQRLARQRRTWLDGGGTWPLARGLEPPTGADIRTELQAVTRWTTAWAQLQPPAGMQVVRETLQMRGIGSQTMPARVEFASPGALAEFVGEQAAWQRATRYKQALLQRWPQLGAGSGVGSLYEWLQAASQDDFERLIAVAGWLVEHPRSGLYLRQLPVAGVDTKWIEGGQRRAIGILVSLLQAQGQADEDVERDFLRLCGLRAPATRMRLMALDPRLRSRVGGLRDLQAPLGDLALLDWAPRTTLFLENLACAHSLPDLPGTVAVVGLGRAVSLAAQLPWIHGSRVIYWGDIDTDGLQILSLARAQFSGTVSVLMDRGTLLRYQARWVPEPQPNHLAQRSHLSLAEHELYDGLLANNWEGWKDTRGVRLEQERLDWPEVEGVLRDVVEANIEDKCGVGGPL
jgi:hypothetical protein